MHCAPAVRRRFIVWARDRTIPSLDCARWAKSVKSNRVNWMKNGFEDQPVYIDLFIINLNAFILV